MKVGKWIIGRNGNRNYGIDDKTVIQMTTHRKTQLSSMGCNKEMRLVGITGKGQKVWTLDQELKEMKGHLGGLFRTKYGREMLDARKMFFVVTRGKS